MPLIIWWDTLKEAIKLSLLKRTKSWSDTFSNTLPLLMLYFVYSFLGFMQFVVNPLFSEWGRLFTTPLSEKMLSNISSNKSSWDAVIAEADAEAVAQKEKEEEVQQKKAQEQVRRILDDSDLSSEEENRCPQIESVQIHPLPRDMVMDSRTFVEDTAMPPQFQQRRHSMPMPMRTKEFGTSLQQHRESLPKVLEPKQMKRRHSLPTKPPLLNGTSIDKLTDKLSKVAEADPFQGSNSTSVLHIRKSYGDCCGHSCA